MCTTHTNTDKTLTVKNKTHQINHHLQPQYIQPHSDLWVWSQPQIHPTEVGLGWQGIDFHNAEVRERPHSICRDGNGCWRIQEVNIRVWSVCSLSSLHTLWPHGTDLKKKEQDKKNETEREKENKERKKESGMKIKTNMHFMTVKM